jgi:hypothetical protein
MTLNVMAFAVTCALVRGLGVFALAGRAHHRALVAAIYNRISGARTGSAAS